MKKWIWIPVLILLIIIFSCQKKNKGELASSEKVPEKEEVSPVAKEVDNKILSAINNFEKGRASEGANVLLEAVLLTKPSEYMPEDFESTILAAREQFKDGNIPKGLELISEALLLIKTDAGITAEKAKEELKDEEQVKRKDEPGPVAELVRNKILAAREEFKKGNAEKGVILILESLLLFGPV